MRSSNGLKGVHLLAEPIVSDARRMPPHTARGNFEGRKSRQSSTHLHQTSAGGLRDGSSIDNDQSDRRTHGCADADTGRHSRGSLATMPVMACDARPIRTCQRFLSHCGASAFGTENGAFWQHRVTIDAFHRTSLLYDRSHLTARVTARLE
jgi:hypothetical protein